MNIHEKHIHKPLGMKNESSKNFVEILFERSYSVVMNNQYCVPPKNVLSHVKLVYHRKIPKKMYFTYFVSDCKCLQIYEPNQHDHSIPFYWLE